MTAMRLASPALMVLGIAAFGPILQRDALSANQDQFNHLARNAATAPILGRDGTPLDRIRVDRSPVEVASIFRNDGATEPKRATLPMGSKKAPYFCNRPVTIANPDITRAIIVVHGGDRNASEYFDSILNTMPGEWRRKTIVLAPHFQEKDDARRDEVYWEGDWSRGGEKKDVSSFAVVDALVAQLRGGAFPNLKWVVITGHSA